MVNTTTAPVTDCISSSLLPVVGIGWVVSFIVPETESGDVGPILSNLIGVGLNA